ncbi:MAG: YkgJ family cysteine cluster protein [Myxococcales bacterium]|nr:YkgJ family cysteine cluster protein [Myxococcales bacterium]
MLESPGGRRFLCTGCGECCRRPGWVFLDSAELTEIATYLREPKAVLRRRLQLAWDRRERRYELRTTATRPCPLLDGDRCSVHPVKPTQCRTYPFWPELVDEARHWDGAQRECEGINHPDGTFFPWSRMRQLARSMEA